MKNKRRALIVVDMQNSFVSPTGSLYVKGAENLLSPIAKTVRDAIVRGDVVVYTQDWHPANHCSFTPQGGPWPIHCVQNTEGAAIHPGLPVYPKVVCLQKGTSQNIDSYSGFYDNAKAKGTGLTGFLRSEGVGEVDVCGVALDYCVKFTALDSVGDGFKTRVLHDLTKAVNINPDDEKKALEALKEKGVEIAYSQPLDR